LLKYTQRKNNKTEINQSHNPIMFWTIIKNQKLMKKKKKKKEKKKKEKK
jgi:hypothetical protein